MYLNHIGVRRAVRCAAAAASLTLAAAVIAAPPASAPGPTLTYADLVDLADGAPLVLRAQVRQIAVVEPARAPGLAAGHARLFVEARLVSLLAGPPQTGSTVRYLADVPLDARGKVPKLTKREVLLFARAVPGKPGELQLVAPDAQVAWSAEGEARLRGILAELLAADAPSRITRVQEALYVPGTLAGEGETQMFLATANGDPASITVVHAPGQPTRWTVSYSEVVDSSGLPPARETLAWYRLACFLPRSLEPRANVSVNLEDKARAAADYAFVLDQISPCPRTR